MARNRLELSTIEEDERNANDNADQGGGDDPEGNNARDIFGLTAEWEIIPYTCINVPPKKVITPRLPRAEDLPDYKPVEP